jgi:hyperosmotically inducible periplasmic protein
MPTFAVERKHKQRIILMRNLNKFMLVTSLTAATAVSCLTGCSTFQQKSSERTAGRMVDDRKIASSVRSELRNDPLYKFHDVDVKTFDGVVQLSGFVNSDEQKRRAEEIAREVPGVVEVQNAISMKPNNTYAPTGRATSQNQNYNSNTYHNNTAPTPATTAAPRGNYNNNNNTGASSSGTSGTSGSNPNQ